ncbi:hypothetical protein B987_02815 [Brucella suis F7/06-5]|nr:hypothetical protein B987_02815 [Brucella suis F7/06-5]
MSDVQPIPLDEILKALANPVRLDILSWLKEPEKHFSGQHMPLEMGVCAASSSGAAFPNRPFPPICPC